MLLLDADTYYKFIIPKLFSYQLQYKSSKLISNLSFFGHSEQIKQTMAKITKKNTNEFKQLYEKYTTNRRNFISSNYFISLVKYDRHIENNFFVYDGLDKLEKLMSEHKGIIVFSNHIGPSHLIPALLAINGFKVSIVSHINDIKFIEYFKGMLKVHNKEIYESFQQNIDFIRVPSAISLVQCVRSLQEGRVLFIQPDAVTMSSTNIKEDTQMINFMGYKLSPSHGTAYMHLKTRKPIISAEIEPYGIGYKLKFNSWQAPLLNNYDITQENLFLITRGVLSYSEQLIMNNLDNWFGWDWFHHIVDKVEVHE